MSQRYHKYAHGSFNKNSGNSGQNISISDRTAYGGIDGGKMSDMYNSASYTQNNHNSMSNRNAYGGIDEGQIKNVKMSNGYNNYSYVQYNYNNYNNYSNHNNYVNHNRFNNNSYPQNSTNDKPFTFNAALTHDLSASERNVIENSPMLNLEGRQHLQELMKEGDEAKERGDFAKEADIHRIVQETLDRKGLKQKDDESQKSYSYNSAVHHLSYYVKKCTDEYGLPFERMFSYYKNENPDYSKGERRHNYYWKVPDKLISTGSMEVKNQDPLRNTESNLAEFADILKIKEERKNKDSHNLNFPEANVNNISAMDKWMNNYEKKNGLQKSIDIQPPQRYENYNTNFHVQQNSTNSMSSMDNYKKENCLPSYINHSANNYNNLNSNNLNYLGIPKRTWN